jgi:uncharacterized protein YcsI (UPF0317 family)
MWLSSDSWHNEKADAQLFCATHFKIYQWDSKGFPWIIKWLLSDTIPILSLHHPDFKPIEAWEQKLPVVQCFGVLPQTVVKK